MRGDVEVVNIAELRRDLSDLRGKMTKKELAAAIRPGAAVMRQAVKSLTPVRTGTLRRAWRIKVGRGSAKAPRATFTTYLAKTYRNKDGKPIEPFYGYFVHNGTVVSNKKRKHRKRVAGAEGRQKIKPNPFVAEAFEANVDRVATMILDNINNML